ncbi:unnamed protein product [Ranitomeya imitator]|uniref:Uncharacterized protein n=1 Tax=Ranitomeya imitator TaxID=111125 RepID=A0ABN9MHL1_9NEOB|nr:unnamed protein product [Ranitomeya imitator]
MKVGANPTHDAYAASWKDRVPADRTVLHVILSLTDCSPCYSLPHRLSSLLFSPSQTVLHVILSLTDCPPCYSLPHRLFSMLFSPSQTVLHVILSLTDCPPCYSLPHRLSSMLFSPSQTALHTSFNAPMILFALAAAAWHWLLQDIVPVYQIKGISKLVKLCLPKVQCFCDSLTSPPSERQFNALLMSVASLLANVCFPVRNKYLIPLANKT